MGFLRRPHLQAGVLRAVMLPAAVAAAWQWGDRDAAAAEPLAAGVAVVDITPPVPFRMCGYFDERLSTGTKDPLQAKAIVFQQADVTAALVFCDLVGIPAELSQRARQEASTRTGIPVEQIAISATHTHTGPLYFGALHDALHDRAVAGSGTDPHDSTAYRATLVDRITAAIVAARAACGPVELRSGCVDEDRLPFNRRFQMKDGSVRFNPGANNPDIVRPAGPVDPQVGIVLLTSPRARQPSAAIVAFGMHLDTLGGTEYSADYPGVAEQRLRAAFGPGFTLLFGAGACGDVNHIDVTRSTRRSTSEIGEMLGDTVAQAIRQADGLRAGEPALAVRSTTVEVSLQEYSDEQVAEAKLAMPRVGSRELPFLDAVEVTKIAGMSRWPATTVAVEVQAFRLDRETAIVTLPAEIFVEIGLAIKAGSPFETTLVVELTNDSLAYIPTRKAFVEGSYEVVNSCVQPGSGEELVRAAIGLLEELR